MANAYFGPKSMKNGILILIDQKNLIGILHKCQKINERWQALKDFEFVMSVQIRKMCESIYLCLPFRTFATFMQNV